MERARVVRLCCGPCEVEICPDLGGCITLFRQRGRDVLRPAGPAFFAHAEPRAAASFPLLPFSNRVALGRFGFRGRSYRLPRNSPPEPHAIHGQGWQHPWTVSEASARRAVLEFVHRIAGTPLDYRGRQILALDDHGLEVALEVANAGRDPMPAGLGLHPYLVRSEAVTLAARLGHVWLADERKLPTAPAPLPAAWNFASGRRIAALALDNCFGGWDGAARIRWPEIDLELTITAEPLFGHLVIYVPPERDFFCVEPVSHVNDGFNLLERGIEGTGVRILEPGERLAGKIRLEVA